MDMSAGDFLALIYLLKLPVEDINLKFGVAWLCAFGEVKKDKTMSRSRRFLDESHFDQRGGKSFLDHEISQLTKIRSNPHERMRHLLPGKGKEPVSAVKMLAAREGNYTGRGRFSSSDCCHLLSQYLPTNGPSVVDQMRSAASVSQFSTDGSLFVAGFQESHIRIYNVDQGWKIQKDIKAKSLRWTMTDTSLSPDQHFLVYSSISPIVHIVDVGSGMKQSLENVTEIHECLEFSSPTNDYDNDTFGIFSVKFSTDGRELVAGSESQIYIYDLEAKRLSLEIPAHMSDVNAVCFADETGRLIYSGSDDSLCKVWDRRCFGTRAQAAGILIGHLEGITYIDTRGDGRHLISNGKDQAIKLWDIRKMSSNIDYFPRRRSYDWDYRWMDYPEHLRNKRHPHDQSLATYKGHSVLRTLIRCYFSPAHSTGQKFIYTGSSDSSVYIYDVVSGAQVAKLDYHQEPVRDCNWHPYYPTFVSSGWDGTIAKWEFPGPGTSPLPAKPLSRRWRRA